MPRLLPPAFLSKSAPGRNIATHSTLQLTLLGEGTASTGYFFSTAKIVVDTVTYQPHLVKTAQMQTSLARAVDRVELQLQNMDDVLGIDLIKAREDLYGAEVRVGRFRKDLESGAEAHKILFSGVVTSITVRQDIVIVTVISDAYAGVSVGADRRAARLCQFIFRHLLTCGYAGTQMVCNKMLNDGGGCEGRHGSPLKQAKYGGMAYIEAAPTETVAAALTPAASNQVIQTSTDSFLQRPFTKFIGFSIVDNPTTLTTEISGGGTVNDWINIKDYGAVGDGVTNDNAAVMAAIAVAETGPRRTVYYPAGSYNVTPGIISYGRVNHLGSGQGASVILSTANANILTLDRDALHRTGHVQHLTIRGNNSGTVQHGLVLDTTPYQYDGYVCDVRIENTGGFGMYVGLSFSCYFERVYFNDTSRYSLMYNSPNQPGNIFKSCYVLDVNAGAGTAWRIRSGDFIGDDLNGINNVATRWMSIGTKNGADGETVDGAARADLTNCNIESWDDYGIVVYQASSLDIRGRSNFAANQNLGHSVTQIPLYYDLAGDGSTFFSAFLRRGQIDDSVDFGNGLAVYANNQAIHSAGPPPIEVMGAGPGTGGGVPLATYYNTVTSTAEHLTRRDGRVRARRITSATTIQPNGASFIEVDSTGGAFTLSLWWAGWSRNVQPIVYIKDVAGICATNNVTVNAAAGATIDGAASFVMDQDFQSLVLIPDGDTVGTGDYRVIATYPVGTGGGGLTGSGLGDFVTAWNAGATALTSAPMYHIGSDMVFNGHAIWNTDNSNDLGVTGNRPRDLLLGRNLQVGAEYGGPRVTASGNGTQNLDWGTTNQREFTFTGNTTFTFSGGVAGHSYTLVTKQDATGGFTLAWPASTIWPGGVDGVVTSGANSIDVWGFYFDGTAYFSLWRSQNLS